MTYLILIRHGQSQWNLENRFTGWVDVNLTANGELEAKKAGELIKESKIKIDYYFSSIQIRANNTLKIVQKLLNDEKEFTKAWQLNERHYGALTGLNKIELSNKLGEEKVYKFRRSWDLRPDPLDRKSNYHPLNIDTYKNIPKNKIPNAESLKDTYERVINYFKTEIAEKIKNGNVLISAHGNSLRSLCKYLFKLNEKEIIKLEIPTGNPLLIKIDKNLEILECKYLDNERAKDLLVF